MGDDVRGGLLPAYLIVGSDELKRTTAVRRLKARLDQGLTDFNLDEMSGLGLDEPQTLISSLNMLPFGAGFRLVIVDHAGKLARDVSEAIVSYLSDPNPTTVLCLVSESLPKNTRLYKALAKVGKNSVVDCAPKKRWELPAQVVRMASGKGVRMDQPAAKELVARVGESTKLLDAQLDVLAQICRERGVITQADVESHVARTAEVKPWDFLDALSARDAARALELYQLMVGQGSSQVMLCALVAGRLRELVCARSLAARGQAGMLAKELGRQQFQVKNHAGWVRHFADGELEDALVRCAHTDRALKSGGNPDIEMTKLILSICGKA